MVMKKMIFVLCLIVEYEIVLHMVMKKNFAYEVIVYGNHKDGENEHGKQCINMFIKY